MPELLGATARGLAPLPTPERMLELRKMVQEMNALNTSQASQNDGAIRRFCFLCIAAQRVMTDLCDTGKIRVADVRLLDKLFQSYSSSFVLPTTVRDEEMISPGEIGQAVSGDLYAMAFPPIIDLFRSLFALVSDARVGRARLQRCQECTNVYVPTKSRQFFCSHRCGDRVSARRRRVGESDQNRRSQSD